MGRRKTEEGLVSLHLLVKNTRLSRALEEKGLFLKDLALIAGISISCVEKIESCQIIPSREEMDEIASALDKPVAFLFPSELIEAIKGGVFRERKTQLKSQQVISLTEIKRQECLSLRSSVEEILLKDQVGRVLDTLPVKERRVLTLSFGLDGGGRATQGAIGKELGVSGSTVYQVEQKALRMLRHPSRSVKLRAYRD